MKRGFLAGAKAAKLSVQKEGRQAPSVELDKEKRPDAKEDKTQSPKFTYDASTGWTLKYSQHIFSHLVIPTGNSNPDETTDCLILRLEDKNLIPKYLSPMRKPPNQAFEIRNATDPKVGLGMFATRDLQVGDLIASERPILLAPRLLDSVFITGKPTFFPPLKNPANREAWESIFCPFFERISKEKQDEYRALMNSHPEEGIGPLLGIFRTNSFEHSLDETDAAGSMYSAIYGKNVSRINHSCASNNSQMRFYVKSFSMEVRALRDIKAGDEIFVSFTGDSAGTTAERQLFLAQYGFQCTCASCTNPVSDHLYLKFLSSHEKLDESYESWLKDLTLPEDHLIRPSLVWTSMIEKQGLPVMSIYLHHLNIITKSFVALGDLENSMKHGMKWARVMIAMTGREFLMEQCSDPAYYSQDECFATRPGRVGKAKGRRIKV